MEWSDEAIVLSRRRHGEAAAVVALFTRSRGRHLGLVRGGSGQKAAGIYQPGTLVRARWRGRLEEHLGSIAAEPMTNFAARVLDDPLRLAALASMCAIVEATLPEREPHERLYAASLDFLGELERPDWAARYCLWEARVLADLGFGLDLAECAATGARDDLAFVSPKSGRAVSREAGAAYADRLFRLPGFLAAGAHEAEASFEDVDEGLRLTGYFLERNVLAAHDRPVPNARVQLVERWRRRHKMW